MKDRNTQTGSSTDNQPLAELNSTQLEAAYLFNAMHTDCCSHLRSIRTLAGARAHES